MVQSSRCRFVGTNLRNLYGSCLKFYSINFVSWHSFFSTLMKCSASALACSVSGVFRSWRNPLYLLKSQNSWLLNGGPLSLLTDTGMHSETKVLSIFGITVLTLVEMTNSTSGHIDCLHTVPSRYSPIWMGPRSLQQHLYKTNWAWVSYTSTMALAPMTTVADLDFELRRGPVSTLLAQPAFLPPVISFFFTRNKRGGGGRGGGGG